MVCNTTEIYIYTLKIAFRWPFPLYFHKYFQSVKKINNWCLVSFLNFKRRNAKIPLVVQSFCQLSRDRRSVARFYLLNEISKLIWILQHSLAIFVIVETLSNKIKGVFCIIFPTKYWMQVKLHCQSACLD